MALNSDAWLKRKKGYVFMPWQERAEILRAILRGLAHGGEVVEVDDASGNVSKAIVSVRPTYFANGGDRTAPNDIEHWFCEKIGVKELFDVGGGKVQSSSWLVRGARE